MTAPVATTLRNLIEAGFNLDQPLYVVDPQNEDGAFPLQLDYDLTVTVTHDAYNDASKHVEAILLTAREDFDAVIVHD